MEIKISGVGPVEDSFGYIVGMVSPDLYVVFSPIPKTTALDFMLGDSIDLDLTIIGPTDAFNKTRNKSVNICTHAVNINLDEVREKYLPDYR